MAFSDYKSIADVQAQFKTQYLENNIIETTDMTVSPLFLEEFEFNRKNIDVFTSEASRCEIVIFPILREVYKKYYELCSIWVQKSISYDEKLNGTPDYIISKRSGLGKTMLETPLLIVAEAKKNDFEQGWGQCLAELIASQKINNDDNMPIYGIVTDGKLWEFGKLTKNVFIKNIDIFTVNELSKLFGALNFVFYSIRSAL